MRAAELSLVPEGVQPVAVPLREQGYADHPAVLDGAARAAQQATNDALECRGPVEELAPLVRREPLRLLGERAKAVAAMAANVPSPCVSVCRMDVSRGLCEGCFRTVEEITVWSRSDDLTKQSIWAALAQRLERAAPSTAGETA